MPNRTARKLRKNSTNAERRLWFVLRDRRLLGYKIRRQRPIGPYIVDFACVEQRLVIEVDGSQHAESQADEFRTRWLENRGWRVLRIWNNDISNKREDVLAAILNALKPSPTQPCGLCPPSPAERERESCVELCNA
jgi:very-short-patch-repair endonuclease